MPNGYFPEQYEVLKTDKNDEEKIGAIKRAWDALTNANFLTADKIISRMSLAYWEWVGKNFKRVSDWWNGIEAKLWDEQVEVWQKRGWIDEDTAIDFLALKATNFPLNIFILGITYVSVHITFLKQLMYVSGADLRRKMFSKYEPEDVPAREIITAAFIAPEKTTAIRQIMMNQGYPEEQIDLMFLAMYRIYDENVIRNLYLRGVLSEENLFERMRELGYTDTRIKEMVQGWPVIPNVADLFHLVAKEAFEPDIIEHYGYADEFPEEQVKWLKMQGLSKDWALKFWYAHWDTPSIQHGFEMLHRQDPDNPEKKIIDYKELNDLFRTIEIPPFWRDKLTKIAFMPYTRVDVRRMHKAGVLTDEELQLSYEDLGYDYKHALAMVNFTKKFNTQADKDLTRAEIVKGYSEGLILIEDAKQLLVNMGYSEDEAVYLTTYEEYKKDKGLQDLMLKNIQQRFEGNLLTEPETRERLNTLNLSGNHIDILMDKWQINRFEDMKIPSKADLGKMFANEVIDEPRYREEMFKLGYNPEYIDWYLQLEFAIQKAKKK